MLKHKSCRFTAETCQTAVTITDGHRLRSNWRQTVRRVYRLFLASAFAVAFSALPAAAQMLYLKCEFADYRCNPQTFRINLKTGDWGSYCPGRPFHRAKYKARINNETIFLPSADSDEYLSVNRVTGSAVMLQKLNGVCRKEGKRSNSGSQAF